MAAYLPAPSGLGAEENGNDEWVDIFKGATMAGTAAWQGWMQYKAMGEAKERRRDDRKIAAMNLEAAKEQARAQEARLEALGIMGAPRRRGRWGKYLLWGGVAVAGLVSIGILYSVTK